MSATAWIQKNYAAIERAAAGTKIFPEVIAAAAILESSGLVNGAYVPGQSALAKIANNYFGIKDSPGWNGPVISMQTGEIINGNKVTVTGVFRKYNSLADSVTDYINFLKNNPRYKNIFSAISPEDQANKIHQAGYATDPNYSSKLKQLINQVRLSAPSVRPVSAIAIIVAGFIAYKILKA